MTLEQDVQHIQAENDEATHAIESFEVRWKFAVFPAMIAFVVLACFGFYLIYGILQRMERLATDVSHMTQVIEKGFPAMTADMHELNQTISRSMPALENEISVMSSEMKQMSTSTTSIATSTQNMGENMWEVNKSISTPMSMMNSMIPWSNVVAPRPPQYINPQQLPPSVKP